MIVSYWECLTHECGSTRFNNLARHQWDDCNIRKKTGRLSRNTWHNSEIGGLNGDVSRKFYPAWDKLCNQRQHAAQRTENWERQLTIHEEHIERKNIYDNF